MASTINTDWATTLPITTPVDSNPPALYLTPPQNSSPILRVPRELFMNIIDCFPSTEQLTINTRYGDDLECKDLWSLHKTHGSFRRLASRKLFSVITIYGTPNRIETLRSIPKTVLPYIRHLNFPDITVENFEKSSKPLLELGNIFLLLRKWDELKLLHENLKVMVAVEIPALLIAQRIRLGEHASTPIQLPPLYTWISRTIYEACMDLSGPGRYSEKLHGKPMYSDFNLEDVRRQFTTTTIDILMFTKNKVKASTVDWQHIEQTSSSLYNSSIDCIWPVPACRFLDEEDWTRSYKEEAINLDSVTGLLKQFKYLDVEPKWYSSSWSWRRFVLDSVGPEWGIRLLKEARDQLERPGSLPAAENQVVKANVRYLDWDITRRDREEHVDISELFDTRAGQKRWKIGRALR